MSRFKSSHPEHQIYEDSVALYLPDNIIGSSSGETADGTGVAAVEIPGNIQAVVVQANIAPMLAVGDTFDLFVQTLFIASGVEIWVDVIHFTQILGNGSAVSLYDKITSGLDEGFFEIGTTLAADAQRNLLGKKWRVRWEIGGATPEFTFDVALYPG